MKPVRQTRVNAENGDCFEACLASLLELPLDAIPVAPGDAEWAGWIDDVLGPWLAERNLYLLGLSIINAEGTFPPGYWLGTTKAGPLGCHHSVVMRGSECVFDPERGRGGTFGIEDLVEGAVLAPIDPARACITTANGAGAAEAVQAQT